MSMDFFRDRRNSTFTMIIFALIILTFIFWGVYDFSGGGMSNTVVRVNGDHITRTEYNAAYQNQLRRFRQFLGGQINERIEEMIRDQTIRNLVGSYLLAQKAQQKGLMIGGNQIIAELEKMEIFQDPTTRRFSPSRYREIIENSEYRSRKNFEEGLSRDLLSQQLQSLFSEAVMVSQLEVRERKKVESMTMTLESALFSPQALRTAGQIPITEDALREYHASFPGQFLESERRQLQVARFNTVAYRNQAQVSEEEIERFHNSVVKDSESSRWNQKRARALHILVSDSTPEGRSRSQRIKTQIERQARDSGRNMEMIFREIAMLESEDFRSAFNGGDLGYFDETEMVEPFSAAVFDESNPLRQLIGPIQSDFGWHLILPLDRTRDSRVLENRREEIRYLLQAEQLEERLRSLRSELRAQIVGKDRDFESFFSDRNFEVFETESLDRQTPQDDIPMVLIQKAFQLSQGVWAEPEEFEDNLFIVRVLDIVPPQILEFELAREAVEEAYVAARAEELVQEIALELRSGDRSFGSLRQLGAEMRRKENHNPYVEREVPGFGDVESIVRSVQGLSELHPISQSLGFQGNWVVFKASDIQFKEVEPEAMDLLAESLESQVQSALFQDFNDLLLERARIPDAHRELYNLRRRESSVAF